MPKCPTTVKKDRWAPELFQLCGYPRKHGMTANKNVSHNFFSLRGKNYYRFKKRGRNMYAASASSPTEKSMVVLSSGTG